MYHKDKQNIDKLRIDTNGVLWNFVSSKIWITSTTEIEGHLGVKKLHLNKRSNSIFAKNLVAYIRQWLFKSRIVQILNEDYNFDKECGHDDSSILANSDAKSVLNDIRVTNLNKLIFGHLNINSIRNKFDFLCSLSLRWR